jgi:hypothetical protein
MGIQRVLPRSIGALIQRQTPLSSLKASSKEWYNFAISWCSRQGAFRCDYSCWERIPCLLGQWSVRAQPRASADVLARRIGPIVLKLIEH